NEQWAWCFYDYSTLSVVRKSDKAGIAAACKAYSDHHCATAKFVAKIQSREPHGSSPDAFLRLFRAVRDSHVAACCGYRHFVSPGEVIQRLVEEIPDHIVQLLDAIQFHWHQLGRRYQVTREGHQSVLSDESPQMLLHQDHTVDYLG